MRTWFHMQALCIPFCFRCQKRSSTKSSVASLKKTSSWFWHDASKSSAPLSAFNRAKTYLPKIAGSALELRVMLAPCES